MSRPAAGRLRPHLPPRHLPGLQAAHLNPLRPPLPEAPLCPDLPTRRRPPPARRPRVQSRPRLCSPQHGWSRAKARRLVFQRGLLFEREECAAEGHQGSGECVYAAYASFGADGGAAYEGEVERDVVPLRGGERASSGARRRRVRLQCPAAAGGHPLHHWRSHLRGGAVRASPQPAGSSRRRRGWYGHLYTYGTSIGRRTSEHPLPPRWLNDPQLVVMARHRTGCRQSLRPGHCETSSATFCCGCESGRRGSRRRAGAQPPHWPCTAQRRREGSRRREWHRPSSEVR